MSVVKEQSEETSPVLFLNEKGEPMHFYIRPGPTKMQIQPLITNGGGVLCRTQEPSAILLADPGEISSFVDGVCQFYISTQYIRDCVLQNQQVDLESYRLKNVPSIQTRSTSRKQRGSGRMGYSLEDDTAILDFISKRRQEAKGNKVWQLMALQGVTSHSWQSMKYRFLKHLQQKLMDNSPDKRKYSSSSEDNVCQNSPQKEGTLKTLVNSSSDSNVPHVSPDEGMPADQPEPQSSSEKNNSLQHAESEKNQLHDLGAEAEKEPLGDKPDKEPLSDKPDQELLREEEQQQCQQESERLEVSPKRARVDMDGTGKETSEDPNKQTTPTETRRKAPSKCGKKLGILERAAREFEDSQVVDGESQEDRPPSRASVVSDSDEIQIMVAREKAVREQEVNAELRNSKQHARQAQNNRSTIDGPVDFGAGPSNAAIPVTSNAHMFIFDQESQEDLTQMSQTEPLTQDVLETKQQVVNLMQESKKELVEVMKALLKASGDVTLARSYLLKGYSRKEHGPLWTRDDDEVILLADPSVLEQLIEKYGADSVSNRRRFLQAH